MTDRPANKAVGIRIPIALWDKLEAYGLEHHPKAEGFDLTQSMVTLMANALDMPLDEIVKRPSGSEDVRSLIEQALIPIQNHTQLLNEGFDEFRGELGYVRSALAATAPKELLADIMNRIDRLEAAINGKSQSKSRTSATTTEEPHPEVIKLAKRLEADPDGLQMSVRAGIAEGLGGKALCEFLFEHGHGANNGSKPFDSSVAGRFIKAIAYLDEQETTAESPPQGDS
jgi:hypothetical protein